MSAKRKSLRHLLPKIVERDGGEWKCRYCGIKLVPVSAPMGTSPYYYPAGYDEDGDISYDRNPEYREPEVEHVRPHSKGGSDELDNLVVSCHECNAHKAAKL